LQAAGTGKEKFEEEEMFDTTIVKQGESNCVPYAKTVTINRAPTDKSVELLNEFHEQQ
jgi:hypothetical protein